MTYAHPQADPTDVVGRRIGAYAIDGLLMAVLAIAVIWPLFVSASETAPSSEVECADTSSSSGFDDGFDDDLGGGTSFTTEIDSSFCFELGDEVRYVPDDRSGAFVVKTYGFAFGLQLLNLVVLQGLTGASVGKLLVGLRVIRADGAKAGLGWAALRWVLLFVDTACCFLPGAILVFTTKGHRRIGDMAANTFVVRTEQVGTPPQVPGVTTAATWPSAGPAHPQAGGWPAGPTAPGGWSAAPGAGSASTWAPPPTAAQPVTPPTGEGPTWDAVRNAYIQYDRDQGAWVQWDDATRAWRPIDQ